MLKRILLTTDTVGGVWRYSLELAHGLAARGTRVVLTTLGPPPNQAQREEATAIPGLRLICTNLPLDWLAESPAQLTDAARVLARMARLARVDTVQLHSPALVGDAVWPVPVVAVAHSCVGTWWRAVHGGTMPADLAWRAEAIAGGIVAADAVIAPSRSFAAALATQYGFTRRLRSVHNGRRATAISAPRGKYALTAGRLWDVGKNIAVIDAAARQLDFPVQAAGPVLGPHGEAVSPAYLRLLGQLDDAAMARQLASAAVFVSTALYEPFGLAVLEAAQAGCALVLADISTFRELWDCAAVFVDSHDANGLATELRGLIKSPARCAHLGELARRRAGAFSLERMTEAMLRIHLELRQPAQKVAA